MRVTTPYHIERWLGNGHQFELTILMVTGSSVGTTLLNLSTSYTKCRKYIDNYMYIFMHMTIFVFICSLVE